MARREDKRQLLCYHCGHEFVAGGRAMSMPCARCNKVLLIEDVVVKSYKGLFSVETCGRLIIERKGSVVAQRRIVAHEGIEVLGTLDCRQVISGGLVHLGPKAKWHGDLLAPALAVEAGAAIRSSRFRIPSDPLHDLREWGLRWRGGGGEGEPPDAPSGPAAPDPTDGPAESGGDGSAGGDPQTGGQDGR